MSLAVWVTRFTFSLFVHYNLDYQSIISKAGVTVQLENFAVPLEIVALQRATAHFNDAGNVRDACVIFCECSN